MRNENVPHASPLEDDAARPRRAAARNGERLKQLVGYGRDLPRRLEDQMKTRPHAALATVGGASFLLGALLGSRIGRAAMIAAIGYGVSRLLEGDLGSELGEYVRASMKNEEDS